MTVTILVTAVGGGGIGHEVVKALQLTGPGRYRVIAADASPGAFGFRDAEARVLLPPAHAENYLTALVEAGQAHGARVVIPGSEAELKVLAPRRATLDAHGLLLLANDAPVVSTCLDKGRTMAAIAACGVRVPRWAQGAPDELAATVAWDVSIVKPLTGGGGSNQVFLAQDPSEVQFFAAYLLRNGATPMVQEYVGDAEGEYTVGVLHDLQGELIGSVAMRRDLRSALSTRSRIRARRGGAGEWLTVSSGVSQGVMVDAPEIRAVCERLATSLGSKGPLNIQLRMDRGDVVPFEINPRFSGTTAFRAMAGCNEPDLLIRRHVLAESLPPLRVTHGRAVRALQEWLIPDGLDASG